MVMTVHGDGYNGGTNMLVIVVWYDGTDGGDENGYDDLVKMVVNN